MQAVEEPVKPRRRGRPRDPGRDEAILVATLEVLAEQGYDAVRLSDVAKRAGAGYGAIYRRWPSKEDLVVAAVERFAEQEVPRPDTGTVRGDLLVLLRTLAHTLTGRSRRFVPGLLVAAERNPELARRFRDGFIGRRRAMVRGIFERGIETGQLEPGFDIDLVVEVGPAMVFFRLLLSAESLEDPVLERIADELVLPLVQPRR